MATVGVKWSTHVNNVVIATASNSIFRLKTAVVCTITLKQNLNNLRRKHKFEAIASYAANDIHVGS